MYRIIVKKSVIKEIKNFPLHIKKQIDHTIQSLAKEPTPAGVKKIKGLSRDFIKHMGSDSVYRVRVAEYRIIYIVFEQDILICIVKIGLRKDVYRFIK